MFHVINKGFADFNPVTLLDFEVLQVPQDTRRRPLWQGSFSPGEVRPR